MLCEKCHQKEATNHFTFVMNGVEESTDHLCRDCAPATGFEGMSLEQIKALSITGKKCEFCGKDAFTGARASDHPTYLCHECGMEYGRLRAGLLAERPDLMERLKSGPRPLFTPLDTDIVAWFTAASEKAIQMMKDRAERSVGDQGLDGV